MRSIFLVFLLFSIPILGYAQSDGKAESADSLRSTRVEIFEADNGWGYDVYVDDKKYIHQTTIPSVPGTTGFVSKKEAQIVAEFVIGKINRNEMPPSVTPEELKELNITLNSDASKSSDR